MVYKSLDLSVQLYLAWEASFNHNIYLVVRLCVPNIPVCNSSNFMLLPKDSLILNRFFISVIWKEIIKYKAKEVCWYSLISVVIQYFFFTVELLDDLLILIKLGKSASIKIPIIWGRLYFLIFQNILKLLV